MKDGIHPNGYTVTNKQTNADRIRSMTDEELLGLAFSMARMESTVAFMIATTRNAQ